MFSQLRTDPAYSDSAPILLAHESRTVGTDLLLPTKIFLHKDKLIIFEQVKNDMFKVFDPQTFEHLYSSRKHRPGQ